jgi:hypothetical protein
MSPGITFGSTTTPFTIECFFYTNSATDSIVILGSGGTGVNGLEPYPNKGFSLYCNGNYSSFTIDSSGEASLTFNFDTTIQTNTWYYLAVMRNNAANVQMWLGNVASGVANKSTTCNGYGLASPVSTPIALTGTSPNGLVNYSNVWNLSSPTYIIGSWVNTLRYNNNTIINNLRVNNNSIYNVNANSLSIPTTNFTSTNAVTKLLINNGNIIDQSNTQTITVVSGVTGVSNSPF